MDLKQFLKNVILEAGKLALEYQSRLAQLTVERKSTTQLVTEADRDIEEFLITEIKKRHPEHAVLGEETGEHQGREYRWLIDPIDGTTSFIHGQPFFSVSIGLEKKDQSILGAVYLPALAELFEAEKNQGAFCNGRKIRVSSRNRLAESVVATSLGCRGYTPQNDNLNYFLAVKDRLRGIRIIGSAAMHMCYVAAGRLDGYWQINIKPYDAAAGKFLVTEAGGLCSDFSGNTRNFYREFVATNGKIHHDLIKALASAKYVK
jgi:myo-inositol-1(or 4)-monophosphatase